MLNLRVRSLLAALALAAVLEPTAHAAYSDKTFTVTNSGNGTLTITGAGISGNTAEYALLPGHNCTTVAAGGSCSMTVRLTPTSSGPRAAAALTFNSNGTNGQAHSIALAGTGGASCTAGKQVYSYTGADQPITVPAGCSTATIKAWGAGSAGSTQYGFTPGSAGGGGGFASGSVSGLTPGAALVVVVGQGSTGAAGTYGGGGAGGGITTAGGGLSGVFLGSKVKANALTIAGGAGGAGGTYSTAIGAGGPGGGAQGAAGGTYTSFGVSYIGGGGGTALSGGGAGGANPYYGSPGSALQGGNGYAGNFGTGGGGGYFGGGGSYAGGGGGGSGYTPNGALVSGSGCAVANSSDPDYAPGVGGGGCAVGVAGQNGQVVITWQ